MKREVLSNPFTHVCLVCCTQYQSSKRQQPLRGDSDMLHIHGFHCYFWFLTYIKADKIQLSTYQDLWYKFQHTLVEYDPICIICQCCFLIPSTGLCVSTLWPIPFLCWFQACVKTHAFWREIQALYCLMNAMLLGFNGEVSGSHFGRSGTLCAAGSMNQPQQTCSCV